MTSTMLDKVTVTLSLAAVSTVYLVWNRYRRYLEAKRPFLDLPMAEGSHWYFGHLALLVQFATCQRTLTVDAVDENDRAGFWIYHLPLMVLTRPADLQTVMKHSHLRQMSPIFARHSNQAFGERSILSLSGKEWKIHRTAIHKALSSKMQESKAIIVDVVKVMVESLKQRVLQKSSEPLDMGPVFKMITMDVFGRLAFSEDLQCCAKLEPSPVSQAFDCINEQITIRLKRPFYPQNLFYWFPTELNRQFTKQRAVLRGFIDDQIQQRQQGSSSSGNAKTADLLTEIMAATQDSNEKLKMEKVFSDQALRDVILALLFAGYDTTSITLAYALRLVASHPNVEAECLKEIKGKQLDQPEELKYVTAVVRETLRLYPPANGTVRKLDKPLTLSDGYVVPSGTIVYIPIWSLQRYEGIFPEPDTFRPDRWVQWDKKNDSWTERAEDDDSGTIKAGNHKAFLAFAGGARSCVGSKLAMQEAVITLAGLLRDLRFEVAPGAEELVPELKGIVQCPRGGTPMIVSLRQW